MNRIENTAATAFARVAALFVLTVALSIASPNFASAEKKNAKRDKDALEIEKIERIGIDDLINVAIQAAPKLARARNSIEIARGEAQVAKGVDDWQLNIGLSATQQKNEPVEGKPVQVIKNEQYDGKVSVRRSIPTGGEVTFGLEATRLKEEYRVEEMGTNTDPRTSNTSLSRAIGQVQLTHSILRGFGRGVARADREKAKLALSAGELRAQVEAGELLRDVVEAYWELVHAAISLEVRLASLSYAHEVLKETRLGVRKGDRAKTDLQSAEYAVAVREEAVLNAEIALQDTALGLRRVAGLEIGPDSISLWPSDLPDVGKKRFSLSKYVKRGMRNNPGLRAIILDGKGAGIDVRVAKNGKRPRLDVNLGATARSTGGNFDQAVSGLGDSPEYQVTGGLSFSFDIGNNAAKGNYRAALGRRSSTRIGIEELRREVASSVVLTVHRIRAARKRAQVAAKARELANANLRAERARFLAGRSSSRDLYERQGEIDDASLSQARALADYHQAVVRLQALTGDLLGDYGVEIIK